MIKKVFKYFPQILPDDLYVNVCTISYYCVSESLLAVEINKALHINQ